MLTQSFIRELAEKFIATHPHQIDTVNYEDAAGKFLRNYIQNDGSEAFIDVCSDFDYYVEQLK